MFKHATERFRHAAAYLQPITFTYYVTKRFPHIF